MRLAVIPARGGSKRIPRKNIRPFHGKPIIAWSIDAALRSGLFDRILVSTDDEEIAEVANAFGAETPFVRPPEISDDFATTAAVIRHAVDWQIKDGAAIDYCCCIYATAPFLDYKKLQLGLERIIEDETDFAVSVTNFSFPIQRACRIRNEKLEMLESQNYLTRSQDLETFYHDAGQFYWGRSEAWREERPIFGNTSAVRLSPNLVHDIDTLEDWQRAEFMMSLYCVYLGITEMKFKTEQESFWAGSFGSEYIERNKGAGLLASNLNFFAKSLKNTQNISNCIEFGSNIGMNLNAIKLLYPDIDAYAVEINSDAVSELEKLIPKENIFHESIMEFNPPKVWDLSIIEGVLIHINPEQLPVAYDTLVKSTGQYLLVAEYYNPAPVSIPYRGHVDRLFKRDFAGEILDRHPQMRLVDYGFSYRRDPDFPQDDITWFLLEKK